MAGLYTRRAHLFASVAVVYGTLNPADKFSSITLSGGDLTATSGINGWCSVRSTTSHSSGTWYYEWLVIENSGSFLAAGFANSTAVLNNYIGVDANGISLVSDGSIFKSGSGTASGLGALAEGDIISLAIDLANDTFWVRRNGGNWNGSGTANPATNTGGVSLPSGLTSGNVFAGLSFATNLTSGAVNFGASAFTYSVPSGFSAWA